MGYILYKHPIQYDTLNMVQYLYNINVDIQPIYCIERNHGITILPTIYDVSENKYYYGIEEVVRYYEINSKIGDLLKKSMEFKKKNPSYKIKK
jgi:hypothetical protein